MLPRRLRLLLRMLLLLLRMLLLLLRMLLKRLLLRCLQLLQSNFFRKKCGICLVIPNKFRTFALA